MNIVSQTQLRETLQDLSSRCRTANEAGTLALDIQVSKAELSLVLLLCNLCMVLLTERKCGNVETTQFLNLGEIRDVCDNLALRAFELQTHHDEAEACMEQKCDVTLDDDNWAIIKDLIDDEVQHFECTKQTEAIVANELSAALVTIFKDVRDQLFKTLRAAKESQSKEELLQLGENGFQQIENACHNWLSWSFTRMKDAQQSRQTMLQSHPKELSSSVAKRMSMNIVLNDSIVAIKRAMLLRCQQSKMASLTKRINACSACADIVAHIECNIIQ